MCEDHAPGRRTFLRGSAALAGAALVAGRAGSAHAAAPRRLPLHSAARPVSYDGTRAYSMAMHIHTSASEQSASVESHLYQAAVNSVDVCWFTDHDGRMDAYKYRDTVHFTSLTDEVPPPSQGGKWVWKQQESGPLRAGSSGGGIVQYPCSPNDPVRGGSLSLAAQSASGSAASFGFYVAKAGGYSFHDNLTGQSLLIDVLLNRDWAGGYLEMLIGTSLHEASASRPTGIPQISYRFAPGGGGRSYSTRGNLGIVTVPVDSPSGGWVTVTLSPAQDIAQLWPELDHRDFGFSALALNAVSTGDLVSGYFDYLRFERTLTGGEIYKQQQSIGADLAWKYPTVTQQWGLEVSRGEPHCNWFGPGIFVPSYQGVGPSDADYLQYLKEQILPAVRAAGALYSYNHPYGIQGYPLAPQARQGKMLRQLAATLLPTRALGADLLEVGYTARGSCDLDHHLGLWDVMSRNAVFMTGNGTTDDHFGNDWQRPHPWNWGNWVTGAWAASTQTSDLLPALAAGRVWCGSLSSFGGPGAALDMLVDGSVPMGAVSVSQSNSRSLAVTVSGLPAGGAVQLLQGEVDYAGTADPTPNTVAIKSWTQRQVDAHGRTVTTRVDSSRDTFLRAIVTDAHGNTVGTGNPVWLLSREPPGGIPAPRQSLCPPASSLWLSSRLRTGATGDGLGSTRLYLAFRRRGGQHAAVGVRASPLARTRDPAGQGPAAGPGVPAADRGIPRQGAAVDLRGLGGGWWPWPARGHPGCGPAQQGPGHRGPRRADRDDPADRRGADRRRGSWLLVAAPLQTAGGHPGHGSARRLAAPRPLR
jgi:hypothetical protein